MATKPFIRVEIEGLRPLQDKMRRLPEELRRPITEGLYEASLLAQNKAREMILRWPKTGRIYTETFRMIRGRPVPVGKRSRPHQASAPGEPPASDSGKLVTSVNGEANIEETYATVEARSAHAVFLEKGTRWVKPRPFLLRAVMEIAEKVGPEIAKRVKDAIARMRSSGGPRRPR